MRNWTAKDVVQIWSDWQWRRDQMEKIRLYFQGKNRIPELETLRLDGREKSKVKTNWTKYAAGLHTGFLTSHPAVYGVPEGSQGGEPQALSEFRAFARQAGTAAADSENFRCALLYGFSAEPMWFDGDRQRVRTTWPWDWALVEDEDSNLKAAVRRVVLDKWAVWRGVLYPEGAVFFELYTPEKVYVYQAQQNYLSIYRYQFLPDANAAAGLRLAEEREVPYGRVPVTVYRVSEDGEPFLDDAFFHQCDAYDVTRSSMKDDIKHNVDALLKTIGFNYEQWMETDEKGRMVLDKLKEMGILPLPDGADAGYLTRTVDVEKFRYDLKVTRASIHLMAAIPDLDETIGGNEGTITNISGVALKLMFHGMIQQSADFEKHFVQGLRRRVDLWNAFQGPRGRPMLEDVEIKLKRNLPFNDTELVQYLPNLNELLTVEDRLKLLPFVDDPEGAAARLRDSVMPAVQPPPEDDPPPAPEPV